MSRRTPTLCGCSKGADHSYPQQVGQGPLRYVAAPKSDFIAILTSRINVLIILFLVGDNGGSEKVFLQGILSVLVGTFMIVKPDWF